VPLNEASGYEHSSDARDGAASALGSAGRKRKRRRWLWFVVTPGLVFLAGLGGTSIYLKSQVDRRLATAISEADRDDPNWRLADLMKHREVVPDGENSSLLVRQVLGRISSNWPAPPIPPPGMPREPVTATEEAFDAILATPQNVLPSDEQASALRQGLDEVRDALEIARTIKDYPRGRHEIELVPNWLETRLAETQASRSVARLLSADAILRVRAGDGDGALDSCRAILCVARSIGDEPTLVSQLVHIALGSAAVDAARRVLAQSEPSDAALARLQALINEDLSFPLLEYGSRGERAGMDDVVQKLAAGEVHLSDLADGGTPRPRTQDRASVYPWGRLWYAQQRAVMLEWLTDGLKIARRPDAERFVLWDQWENRIKAVQATWHGKFTSTIPLLLTPALAAVSHAQTRYHCDLQSTSLLIAAERHRLKTGAWPSSVRDIEMSLLPKIPIDPFDGQPMRMEHHDGQIFVYSVGFNRQDNHGAFDPRRWMNGPYDVGTSAWDVALRRQRAPLPDLPEDVFEKNLLERDLGP
jgi:hypothetical protein